MSGVVTGGPRTLLRLEGLGVLVAATVAYGQQDRGWWLYAALFLAPDLTMLGYLAGRRAGATLYNFGHWYALPLACMAWGSFAQAPLLVTVGLIWAAHIGFDRALGYGLKYASGFGISHLGLLARPSTASSR
ncbi:DUF4260 domain-containing protein [Methylobacterium isbiliense]|uniref:DUF4260 domain-containing protein n=1 Tax=Methylobacterium isbiliense TaxID=315478 RepID=A0ABQ4SK90_9HYPH|nr:DUF4260 domain-containing protein [Methylobacterium isbiliense]MDN3627512.1 DUF4260 domain-containing protein [Methylobacterium isbiliense]GJE03577.1 hypothetical protein GMJLKIPL_5534 [Methylobacterium isbiliense]